MGLLFFLSLSLVLIGHASSFAVVGYLPEWRYEGYNFDYAFRNGLTHLVFFSMEPSPEAGLWGSDRFPNNIVLLDARAAAKKHNGKVMICFGGNGRSTHFPRVTRDATLRQRFVKNVVDLVKSKRLDGVDINWEYPGFRFGQGYLSEEEVAADYSGLHHLLVELRQHLPAPYVISAAYYPDARQPSLLRPSLSQLDFLHSMSYDAHGAEHSPWSLATQTIETFRQSQCPLEKLTLGVPFYGRHQRTGDWRTWEDLVRKQNADDDQYSHNDPQMIAKKTRLALEQGLAGIMIWEAGQDCRVESVTRNDKTHGVTCPRGEQDSLLVAIRNEIAKFKKDEL